MKKTCIGLIILVCLWVPFPSSTVGADDTERLMVRIPHQFTVGDQSLPPGRYSVTTEKGSPAELHIHSMTGESSAWVPVITRLARHTHAHTRSRMVFDRVGGQHFLSEIWLDGEDGYLVLGTPKEHSHEIIHFGN